MKIDSRPFGKLPDGREVTLFELTNAHGLKASIIDYGATLVSMIVPDRNGHMADVTLGHDNLQGYLDASPYFGSICGRCANRIDRGVFAIDGVEYKLACNEGGRHHLHGGLRGFDKVMWKASPLREADAVGVSFSYRSSDGEEGYPGNLDVTAIYTLTDLDELRINYSARTDSKTVVNLTNHAYWNLALGAEPDVLNHELTVNARHYTPVDETLIPTGELALVKGTPMDFTRPFRIGQRIGDVPGGYDHNYAIDSASGATTLAARLRSSVSGRVMEVHTSEPGIQFYSGNFLNGTITGKGGVNYPRHAGLCLETQHFPNAVNIPRFASTVLEPGQLYSHLTIHKFAVTA